MAGAALGVGAVLGGLTPAWMVGLLALLALLAGRLFEIERALRESMTTALRTHSMMEEAVRARADDNAAHQRELRETNTEWALRVRRLAHDVRTPLAVLKSNVGYLRETPPRELQVEAGAALEDLDLGICKLEALINDASAFARSQDAGGGPV